MAKKDDDDDDKKKEEPAKPPEDPTEAAAFWKKEADKWKGLSVKHEKQAKDNVEAATKLKKIEDEGKSETERLTAAQQTAERERDEARNEALRMRVGVRKGLTETQAKRLVGANEDELEKDADELVATFAPKKEENGERKQPPPRERLRSGSQPAAEQAEDPKKIAESILKERVF